MHDPTFSLINQIWRGWGIKVKERCFKKAKCKLLEGKLFQILRKIKAYLLLVSFWGVNNNRKQPNWDRRKHPADAVF